MWGTMSLPQENLLSDEDTAGQTSDGFGSRAGIW